MNIDDLNNCDKNILNDELTKCCGSHKWVLGMIESRPFKNKEDLFEKAELIWNSLEKEDWLEAFTHHPKIGDIDSLAKKFASTKDWAGNEQSGVNSASMDILNGLAEGNKTYEDKFGYIFIVCATGKTAKEMLDLLNERLPNLPEKELKIAAEEQNKITKIRLEKLLN